MKTVLHIIEHLADFGGTPRKLLYLAAHHDPEANRLIFATYCPSSLADKFSQYNARVVNFETLSVWRLAWKLARLARTSNADVICTHYSRPLFAGFLASRLSGIPFIHNEHSSAHYRTGLARVFAKLCIPFAKAVICNSDYTAATIAKTYNLNFSKINVLYNPVEYRTKTLNREKIRQEMGVEQDTFVIGHVGGMIETRDQATLINAFHNVLLKFPNSLLWLIGDGPLRQTLENLANVLEIGEKVRFFGYTSRIGDYLHAMDIYVNPTVDEGFGIAVVEAMLAPLPVVLANAGAHPELIVEEIHGMLYAPKDSDALATILTHLIEQPDTRHRLSESAQERAITYFSPIRYARGYEKIVANVTSSNQITHKSRVSE